MEARTCNPIFIFMVIAAVTLLSAESEPSLTYIWPLPAKFSSGNQSVSVDPTISLLTSGSGGKSEILDAAFKRYKKIIFKHAWSGLQSSINRGNKNKAHRRLTYDITRIKINVQSDDENLQLGVDESYTLLVAANGGSSIVDEISIEANTVYGALRGLETFSQLCSFNYVTKSVQIYNAPWYIQDRPRFSYRGLLIDTSRHFLPVDVIKGVIDSMSYAKLNVLHWHIIDEQSFPLEVPTYPKLWEGAYTEWERYTVEDAREIVKYAKMRGINVMAEIDVPGHAESWGVGYPELWPSTSCREPLDVTKNLTFHVIDGILTDLRKIFPFDLFHLGGDEVDTGCWNNTPHIKQWLQEHNMTAQDAYQYFVLRAQQIAISKNWTPVNWEETFNAFSSKLNPRTVVHNWFTDGVCSKAVAQGFKCIFSNQGVWYLDHLDVPWYRVYRAEPLQGIEEASHQELVLGGQVCMWGETADPGVIQQTIWPRAAAAAERLWSTREATPPDNLTHTVLPRLHYFRCLLHQRGISAAPVSNFYARQPPIGPGSCYEQ